jgi:hypothetical protein
MNQDYSFQFFGDKSEGILKVLIVSEDKKIFKFEDWTKIKYEVYHFLKNKHIFDIPIACYFGVVKKGALVDISEGVISQINNSAYHTFENFEQFHDNKISKVLGRDTTALINSSLSVIKKYFRCDLTNRDEFESFKKLNFAKVFERLNKEELFILTKASAHVLADSLGKEYHTNTDLAYHYVTVSPFLRKETDKYNFDALKNFFFLYLEAIARDLKYNKDV